MPDTHPSYEDRAYGGAGRDVLIANTGGDRLIDWVGEFNSYLVPFAPFGMATVSRTLQPQLAEFLYALSESDGVDVTRQGDTGNLPEYRNGEPDGELGVVRQHDFDWHEQTGGPTDPQAGNIPGGSRDVLRSAGFNDGTLEGLRGRHRCLGGLRWQVGGRCRVARQGCRLGLQHRGLPAPLLRGAGVDQRHQADWPAGRPTPTSSSTTPAPTDFKFAGIDISVNKLVMGHRDASGWHVDVQKPFQAKPGTFYNVLLAVNGLTATLVVDNQAVFTHTFAPRVVDGYSYGLNYGFVGFGSDNSRGSFDNIAVQVLPPQITYDSTENYGTGPGPFDPVAGAWSAAAGGRYAGTPTGPAPAALSTLDLGLGHGLASSSHVVLDATLSTTGIAGIVFDAYAANDYKFVALDVPGQRILIGHVDPRRGWTIDATIARALTTADTTLSVTLRNAVVTVSVGGLIVAGYAYNAAIADGAVGTLVRGGTASFDSFRIRTNDPAFAGQTPPPQPTVSVSVADAQITEGDRGSQNLTLTVTLSQASTTQITVQYATQAAGTGASFATSGSDYTAKSGTLTFNPGTTTLTFTVSITGDRVAEGNESFRVVLSNATGGATISRGTATATILDNELQLNATTEGPGTTAPALTAADAATALAAAKAAWIAAGADPAALAGITIRVEQLDGTELGHADGSTIVLDADAAGWGWHTDPTTPVPVNRIDLVTVIAHELGHILGLAHADAGVMEEALAPGERELPPPDGVTSRPGRHGTRSNRAA